MKIKGQIVDVIANRIFRGAIIVDNGIIVDVIEEDNDENKVIMPGLIDSHIHIESSMLVPSEFARIAVTHGTVGAICDPHEIANVLGIEGVRFMVDEGKRVPFKFFFGAPSCVPATCFETSGAVIDSDGVEKLLAMDDIYFLGEVMDYVGVLSENQEILRKINMTLSRGKVVDGHVPSLRGDDVRKYASAGISTDHESVSCEEALDKVKSGILIQIRQGSAAKNLDALLPLFNICPDKLMFCTDDNHSDDLVNAHINMMIKKAIGMGYNVLDVIKAATLNPVRHYNVNVGLLQKNDPADFIVIDNLNDFNVLQTFINGNIVAENGKSNIAHLDVDFINNFNAMPVKPDDFFVRDEGKNVKVIEIVKDQIITNILSVRLMPKGDSMNLQSDVENDILKIAVINRYKQSKPVVGFVKNFGLKKGAIASSVAHDSHNIIVVGCTDEDMAEAVNQIIASKGGMISYSSEESVLIPLPIAGLMCSDDGYEVASKYKEAKALSTKLGAKVSSPFMTLGFMALLVIPNLKISDKGLFDTQNFEFVSLYE
ncbi:MAG: adenine deaminase [Candidatus Limimorpha sp.]